MTDTLLQSWENDYWRKACAFYFPDGTMVECGVYPAGATARCQNCKNFETFYQSYKCKSEKGQDCLMGGESAWEAADQD